VKQISPKDAVSMAKGSGYSGTGVISTAFLSNPKTVKSWLRAPPSESAQLLSLENFSALNLNGTESGPTVALLANEDIAAVSVHGRQPKGGKATGVTLSTGRTGIDPQIRLSDVDGHDRANLAITDNGPEMTLFDGPGKPRLFLAAAGGRSELEIKQPSDKVKFSIAVTPNAPSMMFFGSKSGKPPLINFLPLCSLP
jgi:hypothetical protein